MSTETNTERLKRISKTDQYMYDRSGKHITVSSHDFDWLIQQVKRAREWQENAQVSSAALTDACSDLSKCRQENTRLRKALEFYGAREKYEPRRMIGPFGYDVYRILEDEGAKARQALEGESVE